MLDRWTGFSHHYSLTPSPFSIAVCLKPTEERMYRQLLRKSSFPARLGVIPFTAANRSIYPINYLRNLAIDHVLTSHFWLTDMDMWPSRFISIGV